MTKPERPADLNPQGQPSNWIDEVLKPPTEPARMPFSPLAGPQDLKIPAESARRSADSPAFADWPDARSEPVPRAQPSAGSSSARRWEPPVNAWGEHSPVSDPMYISPDVAQKRLVAGLLGIFLGGLGIHKFYLGITNPAIIMLAISIGASIFGFLTLIFGIGILILGLPSLVWLLGFIEGIIYLTKSDADFQRDYLNGKKPWL